MFSPAKDTARFGPFELDLSAWQLRKDGFRVKIPLQPLQLLAMLLERPGLVVSREELRQRLWPADVFVDFDHGLNKNIQKLREALNDSSDAPRYIETIPRTGYRFIGATIDQPEALASEPDTKASTGMATIPPSSTVPHRVWRPWLLWVLVGVVAVGLSLTLWWMKRRSQGTPIRSVAVLPLENLSGNADQQYFADGMTDELITMLAKNSTLRVVSQTSVMQYKGVHRPVRDIARDLGVDGIVEGSVDRSGSRVHMTIQLVHAPSDTNMWAESYDRDAAESVSLPGEAARAIVARLKMAATPSAPQRFVSPEAHEAYLRGRYYRFAGGGGVTAFHDQAIKNAGDYFKRAVALQPDYALAWSGLSDFYMVSALHGDAPPAEFRPLARAAAVHALELDESLGNAHNALAATYLFFDWDWQQALVHSDKAVELEPNNAEFHFFRAKVLIPTNRMEESLKEQEKATELDYFARPFGMGYVLLTLRRYDDAATELRTRLETLPADARLHRMLSQVYWHQGRKQDAGVELEQAALLESDTPGKAAVRNAFEKGGYEGILRLQLRGLLGRIGHEYVSPLQVADQYALLGKKEGAIHFLEEAYKERSPSLVWIQSWPWYDFIHSDSRYQNIVRQIGLPPAF
jgi:TolB-like protein/DNA-binding winged helix-turn-helix (wHTH) protein/tetratricopeptide (TPR) repeat protein